MDADNPAWMPLEPGAVRALSVAVKPMDQGRAWKHDKYLTDRLTDQGVGVLGHAVLTVIGLQNASKLPNRGALAWEGFIGLARAGDAGTAAVILISEKEYVSEGGPGGEG